MANPNAPHRYRDANASVFSKPDAETAEDKMRIHMYFALGSERMECMMSPTTARDLIAELQHALQFVRVKPPK